MNQNIEAGLKQTYQPNLQTKILWWFSTTIPDIIHDCTSDRHRAKIIGSGVIFTWLYATIAWIYFWAINISNPLIYIPLGIFIGYGILTIDRMLIASISKHKNNFIAIAFRVLLAILLGAFIAQPIILWMFEKDINTEVSILHDKKIREKGNEVTKIYQLEKAELKTQDAEIIAEKNKKYNAIENAETEFLAEIDGTGGSGKYGIAGIAKQKEIALNRATKEYEKLEGNTNHTLQLIDLRLREIDSLIIMRTKEFENTELSDGFLIRIEALKSLFNKDETGALKERYYLILIILILFELIPIISKLYLPTGSYDEKVLIRDEVELKIAHFNKYKELENYQKKPS